MDARDHRDHALTHASDAASDAASDHPSRSTTRYSLQWIRAAMDAARRHLQSRADGEPSGGDHSGVRGR